MNKTDLTNHQRRSFLGAAKAAGAVAAIAVLAPKSSEPVPQATTLEKDSAPDPAKYHVSEHIRKYYRSLALM